MTWVRLDDDFPSHRKVRRLSDAAFRLQVSGLCWAAKYLTDGRIPPDDLEMLCDLEGGRDPQVYQRAAEELVSRKVWHAAKHDCPDCPIVDDGWVVHGYLDINPSAEQVLAQREQAAERQRRSRDRRRGPQGRESADDDGVSHASVTRQSQRPTPTPTPNKERTPSVASLPQSSPRRAKRDATRIPDDFAVTADMVEWARGEAPDVDGRRETAAFVDYWRGQPGAKGRKADWIATWRNWMRRAQTDAEARQSRAAPSNVIALRGQSPASRPSTTDQRVSDALALAAELKAQELIS